jgi:cyclopropane fatty-acyl-phospholipid synthase-like methyltransferase
METLGQGLCGGSWHDAPVRGQIQPGMSDRDPIRAHYDTGPLRTRVESALRAAGLDAPRVEWSAFAPLDEFHTRGLAATRELAQALDPAAGARVLDVGSGLGGPARLLAAQYGCDVTGVDLSAEFVDVATMLTERAGLADRVRFLTGDATQLPFDDASFAHGWTQHVAMNIEDRRGLYHEVRRVLALRGRFAVHDIVAVSGEPLTFPVPWAATADTSFLLTADETRAALREAGFDELSHRDLTAATIEWFAQAAAGRAAPGIGLGVVMGSGFAEMTAHLAADLRAGRAGVVELIVSARP